MSLRIALLLPLALLGLVPMLTAQSASQLDNIQLGQHWYGAPISKKDLLGKIVVLELWGVN